MSSRTESRAAGSDRRARLASLLSYVTAAITVAILLLFIWQAGLFRLIVPPKPADIPVVSHPEQIETGPATVSGLDNQNLPYQFTAKSALQDKVIPHLVHLEDIRGTFQQPGGRRYDVSAKTGHYDSKLETLDLEGDVEVVSEGRFAADMTKARLTIREKALTSDEPVRVTLENGSTVIANGLKISDDGHHILFSNGVKASFKAAPSKGDAQP
jgi:LPS export ABC transporter protein LptC